MKYFVVSVVMNKEIQTGFNVINRLYKVTSESKNAAIGDVYQRVESDYPQHRLHTIACTEVNGFIIYQ